MMSNHDHEVADSLITRFVFEKLLNQDSQGRRIILQGTIDSSPALLLAERAAFSTSSEHLSRFAQSLDKITNLGDNDVYKWYLAKSCVADARASVTDGHDLKINLIYPCTEKHVVKYTPQRVRYVIEKPEIYKAHVRPWIAKQRDEGRLNWVFNILDGRTEVEDVIYRSFPPFGPHHHPVVESGEDGFLLLPDLNWDRKTLSALHLLCLVQRRDKWSIRDLARSDLPWLESMVARLHETVANIYGDIGGLKMYCHYQPTYYHLHIHVVSTALDATGTQAVGKALDLTLIMTLLKALPDVGTLADVEVGYTIGEGSELWKMVWQPLQSGGTSLG